MLEQKSFTKKLVLYFAAIFFVTLNISDIRINSFALVLPMFDLMAVFYFASFKRVFGLWFVFILGIWSDALGGNALGITPLCYIIVLKFFAVLNERMLIRENFVQIWRQFLFFCLVFLVLKWLFLSAFNGTLFGARNLMIQAIVSPIFYVVMHRFFDYLSKKLLGDY